MLGNRECAILASTVNCYSVTLIKQQFLIFLPIDL